MPPQVFVIRRALEVFVPAHVDHHALLHQHMEVCRHSYQVEF